MDGMNLPPAWLTVAAIDDIPRLGARVVATARGDVALFRTGDDRVFALDDRCPHKAGKLSQGIVHGHSVTCPLHNWIISLQDGQAHSPDQGCTHVIAVRLQDGRIQLRLP